MDMNDKCQQAVERLGIKLERMPRHLAMIMDGNGRWASAKGLPRAEGHCEGAKAAENIAMYCARLGIQSLTLYSFSVENWKRPQDEIEGLMSLYEEYLISMRPMFTRENVRLIHLGRRQGLPDGVLRELDTSIRLTHENDGMIFAFALNYGGRTEIVDAVRAITQQCLEGQLGVDEIDEVCIDQNLYTATMPDPDLLIRTANEMRVSNFMLWQISYSEFYVTDKYWPDFGPEDLDKAIVAYARRDRRYGALSHKIGDGCDGS
ncbi:MAG: isoprenyl transferase [Planctomycetes bacterium]|nr:isoprenyl transferase [Planctomycetota bacterium]